MLSRQVFARSEIHVYLFIKNNNGLNKINTCCIIWSILKWYQIRRLQLIPLYIQRQLIKIHSTFRICNKLFCKEICRDWKWLWNMSQLVAWSKGAGKAALNTKLCIHWAVGSRDSWAAVSPVLLHLTQTGKERWLKERDIAAVFDLFLISRRIP